MKPLSLSDAVAKAAGGVQKAALGTRYIATVQSVTDRETTGWIICDVFFRDPAADGRVTVRVNDAVDLAASDLIYIRHDSAGQKTFIFDGFVKGGGTGHNDAGAYVPWVQSPGATSPAGHDFNIDPATGKDIILDGVNWSMFHSLFQSLEYVLMSANGQIANERVLTAGDGISLTDAGAGGAATLAVDLVAAWSGLEISKGDLRVDLDAVFDFASDVSTLGNFGIGTASPDYDVEIHVATGDADLALSSDLVAHPFTTTVQSDVFARIRAVSSSEGGMSLQGFCEADGTAMFIQGYIGVTNPDDATPAIILRAYKSNGGTGVAALAAAETVLQVQNLATNLVTVRGDGDVFLLAGGDLYPDGNEAGLQQRFNAWTSWNEHWDVAALPAGWSWANDGAGPFQTAAPATINFANNSLIYFGDVGNEQCFLYRAVVGAFKDKSFFARLVPYPPSANECGIRLDDSTAPATRYVEVFLDYVAGAGARLLVQYNDGAGEVSTTILINQPPLQFYSMTIAAATDGANWRVFVNMGVDFGSQYVVYGGGGKTWTPDRIGLYMKSATAGGRYHVCDAVGGDVCAW